MVPQGEGILNRFQGYRYWVGQMEVTPWARQG